MTPQQFCDLFPDNSEAVAWDQFDYPFYKRHLDTTPFDWQAHPDLLMRLTERLKWLADRAMYGNVQQHCWAMADLLTVLAEKSDRYEPLDHAYRARANYFAHGDVDYERAIGWCESAETLCRQHNDEIGVARAQIAKLWPLMSLGQTEKALIAGEQARVVLHKHQKWHKLADLLTNIGAICAEVMCRDDDEILALYDEALALYQRVGAVDDIPAVQHNRAVRLTYLGHFADAESIFKQAISQFVTIGQIAEAARAEMNLGALYFSQGNYTNALHLFEQAREKFVERPHEAAQANLHIAQCLLEVGRFRQTITLCEEMVAYFESIQMPIKSQEVALHLAVAQAALHEYEAALQTLLLAYERFVTLNQPVFAMLTKLEQATVYLRARDFANALKVAQQCHAFFDERDFLIQTARSKLIMVESSLHLGDYTDALGWIAELQQLETTSIGIQYQTARLSADLTWRNKNYNDARICFDQALHLLESWQGRLMVELRSDFLLDKQATYASAVQLALDAFSPAIAFAYVERAKSRVLVDLFAQRINMRLQARDKRDEKVIEQIQTAQRRRDQLYRQLSSPEQQHLTQRERIRQDISALESAIQTDRELLLNRNAAYAQDMALSHVRTNVQVEEIQEKLAADTLLVEYFVVGGGYVAFVVSAEKIEAFPLSATTTEIQRLQKSLQLDFQTVAGGRQTRRSKKTLQKLHKKLWQPLASVAQAYQQIIVVPHGTLHYLPFHALHDGTRYLIEQFTISYLPNATMLGYLPTTNATTEALIMGHSWESKLPHAVQEAQTIAEQINATCFTGEMANRANFYQHAPTSRLIHLATHGEFSVTNPLFSRLVLADGDVTTLDLLEMQLDASLVVLSACETGRAVIGGGDELLGLTRALLYAGAASLLLTLWRVDDKQTQALMSHFYHYLQDEQLTKANALQMAQRALIEADKHPFYWAAFRLVGHSGHF